MTDAELIKIARTARTYAYAPYSGFQVGAALLSSAGTVYTGVNVENASYGLTVCAERNAIFKAVSEGVTDVEKLAVAAESEKPVPPCGACRQVLGEFMKPDASIVMGGSGENIRVKTLQHLLPEAFGQEDLHE